MAIVHEAKPGCGSETEITISLPPISVVAETYAGHWVAIRSVDGKHQVVQSAEAIDQLLEAGNYQPTDCIYFVPDPKKTYYF